MSSPQGLKGAFPPHPPVPCCECGLSAISMCPACKKHVHQDYGYSGPNCSGRHEGKCEGARKSRELDQKPPDVPVDVKIYVTGVVLKPKKNGVHKSAAKKGR